MKTSHHPCSWTIWDDAGVVPGTVLVPLSTGVNGGTNGQLVWEIWLCGLGDRFEKKERFAFDGLGAAAVFFLFLLDAVQVGQVTSSIFSDGFARFKAWLQRLLAYTIETSSRR